tara:strand:- start:1038 stop:2048 length:1011 start_codon:yes stop_codon:yes gene_type:complete
MYLKKMIFSLVALTISYPGISQVSGNQNYGKIPIDAYEYNSMIIPSSTLDANFHSTKNVEFTVRGLYNLKADSYLAIFTITQTAKSQAELNTLVNDKINSIKSSLEASNEDVEMFTDMVSFLPIYEVVTEKKLFSKKTYNEIPKGFELKKNLHFRFKNQALINLLVSICSEQEIYDLVRVDYMVDNLEVKKQEIMNKAAIDINKKISRYKTLLANDFSNMDRLVAENFAVHYPIEQYQQYQAYCSNSLSFNAVKVENSAKSTSSFYSPKLNKNYDFVMNASILEPVVQIEYVLKIRLLEKPEVKKEVKPKTITETKVVKDIFIVTPDAKVQKLNIP